MRWLDIFWKTFLCCHIPAGRANNFLVLSRIFLLRFSGKTWGVKVTLSWVGSWLSYSGTSCTTYQKHSLGGGPRCYLASASPLQCGDNSDLCQAVTLNGKTQWFHLRTRNRNTSTRWVYFPFPQTSCPTHMLFLFNSTLFGFAQPLSHP